MQVPPAQPPVQQLVAASHDWPAGVQFCAPPWPLLVVLVVTLVTPLSNTPVEPPPPDCAPPPIAPELSVVLELEDTEVASSEKPLDVVALDASSSPGLISVAFAQATSAHVSRMGIERVIERVFQDPPGSGLTTTFIWCWRAPSDLREVQAIH